MIYAFIPLRTGSKGIPFKNIKLLAGKPLAQWVIDTANKCKYINDVIISTDSDTISSKLKNVKIFNRSEYTATDIATSESALLEFCDTIDTNDIIVFIQATSPLLKVEELSLGIELVLSNEFDSAVSVVRQKRFLWTETGIPMYNLYQRPRRQDWNGYLVENGAFYISKVSDIIKSKCRISGKIGIVECSEESYYEIDSNNDWQVVESLINNFEI